jgi:uncharacterized protein (DUF58 family)
METINQTNISNLKKGKFLINFSGSINEFERILQKFPIKKILYKTIFRGKGLEFDTYKVFEQSDDASTIDWKATLRSNEILVKKYIEERDLNIYFIVDVGNSMLFGSGKKLKSEYAAEVVAALSHLIIGSGDRVGLVMFNDKISKVLHPANGKNQFLIFTKFLSDTNLYGGGSNLNNAIEFTLKNIKTTHNVFVIVSDFLSIGKNIERNIFLLGSRFETMAIMLHDPFDENLPNTSIQFSIQDPNSSEQMILDPAIARERYRNAVIHHKNFIKEILKKSHIDFLELTSDKSFVIPLVTFLKNRALSRRKH